MEESIRIIEDRDTRRVWPTLGWRMAKEQNGTEQNRDSITGDSKLNLVHGAGKSKR